MIPSILTRSPTALQVAKIGQAMEVARVKHEKSIQYNMNRAFKAMRLKLYALDDIPTDRDIERIATGQDTFIRRVLVNNFVSMGNELESVATDQLDRSSMEELFEAYVYQTVGVHITMIDDTTRKVIRRMMADADSVLEFQNNLDRFWMSSQTHRSYVIARTETSASSNATVHLTVTKHDTGRKVLKTWHTFGDTAVRLGHREMNGVEIPSDELFEVPVYKTIDGIPVRIGTDRMEFPADMNANAHASNVVNCRCYLTYRYV